ncbi:MAG: DnaJ domain-containing protein [SAR324 cluster bacterium]|nr:DnaJ domain-containing protein [SAR324 cluster bacterium]
MEQDPFDLLEISTDADAAKIKQAYFDKIKIYTPDKHPEKFKEIRKAYEEALKMSKQGGGQKKQFRQLKVEGPTLLSPFDTLREAQQKQIKLSLEKLIQLTF